MAEGFSPALREVSNAVLAVASNLGVEQVLQRLVDVSRGLVHARYTAIGIPDGDGGFAQFLTAGMTEELIARLGPLPATHGLLGAMLDTHESYRTRGDRDDERTPLRAQPRAVDPRRAQPARARASRRPQSEAVRARARCRLG